MPGTITTAIFRHVSAESGTPIVNLFYDGTGGQNRSLEVYLRTALNADSGPPEDEPAAGAACRRPPHVATSGMPAQGAEFTVNRNTLLPALSDDLGRYNFED
jgi:hypothetical protein